MRTIKFRAFDIVTWEIKEVEDIYFYKEVDECWMLWEVTYRWDKCSKYFWENIDDFDLEQAKLMQYTWLKDKNWVEIYEWDIVYDKRNDKYAEVKMNNFWRWSLFWKDWDRMNEYHWEYIFSWINPDNSIEVIWNIYEDSHLLKK